MTKKAYVAIFEYDYDPEKTEGKRVNFNYISWARDKKSNKGTPYGWLRTCFENGYYTDYYPKATGTTHSREYRIKLCIDRVDGVSKWHETKAKGEAVYGPQPTFHGVFPLELFS